MISRSLVAIALGAALVALPAASATQPAAAPAAPQPSAAIFESLVTNKAPAVVTVKFVLKIEPGGQEQESEVEGLVIDPKGLILCSNTQTGGFPAMVQRMMGGSFTATPTNIKVLAGEDTEGVSATLIARDSEMDLSWVRVDDPAGRTFTAVDIGAGVSPKLGESLYAVGRLGKFFDRAPVVQETRLGAITRKPRRLFVPSSNTIGEFGSPVFNAEGGLVGVTVLQLPDPEDVDADSMGNMRQMMSVVILPAEDIAKATKRALEVAGAEKPVNSAPPGTATSPAQGKDQK